MTAGRVHLLYGLTGSGKSTLARRLCQDGAAVRFTLDEWMLRLYPELSYDDAAYGRQADVVREVIWTVAEQVLAAGTDAVLDWNSWSRMRRAWAVQRAQHADAEVILHWLTTGLAEADRRLAARAGADTPYVHPVTTAGNAHLQTLMEPPGPAEGCRIIRH
ncbi:AAA family ATPase [Ruania zhangjianzhongii]|uniref:AAA family ATPase n=1 Tax=Ruania zhangjianzhongii TaxID=2603206 RepID=UPI0011C777E0|nr:ATP-binding protein [Ruania zhangjianzhongii]